MNIWHKIQDIWYNTFVLKHDVESEVTNISEDLIIELIKIIKWHIPKQEYLKTVSKINQYLYKIGTQDYIFKSTDYFRIIFKENIHDYEYFKMIVRYDLEEYLNDVVKLNNKETCLKLNHICRLISSDLANSKDIDIEDYLRT